MRKRLRIFLIFLVICALGICWVCGYRNLNAFYSNLSNNTRNIYQLGETVPFGSDYMNKDILVDGYSVRVDRFEIVNYQEYIRASNFSLPDGLIEPERIGLVYITLFNQDSNAPGVLLTEFKLHGIDNYLGMNWDVLLAANSVLKEGFGVSLSPNTEYQIILPFDFEEEMFGADTWKNINDYELFLHITAFPTEKDIKIQ